MKTGTKPAFSLRSRDGKVIASGTDQQIREAVTKLIDQHFGFHIMLEHITEDTDLCIFLHSDNFDDLSLAQHNALRGAGLIIDDYEEVNHETILELLKVSIQPI